MKNLCLWLVSLLFFIWVPTASAQTAEAPPPVPATPSSLTVSEASIATGIEGLTPQGEADSFESGVGILYAFTKITGANEETLVKHRWSHEDQLMAEVELPVRSASWRTYSSKTIAPAMTGQWKLDVTAQDGTVLKSIPFTIK
ncbi:MAG: DUF2914 domain-containing protein [Nitrospiria bacterium]